MPKRKNRPSIKARSAWQTAINQFLTNSRTRNFAPVDSQIRRAFSISSAEITSTTVIRTSSLYFTQSAVNLSMASNALPGKMLRVILSYFSEVISLRETETESIFLQISCAVGLPFIKSERPFVFSLSLISGCVFSYIRLLQAANRKHL